MLKCCHKFENAAVLVAATMGIVYVFPGGHRGTKSKREDGERSPRDGRAQPGKTVR